MDFSGYVPVDGVSYTLICSVRRWSYVSTVILLLSSLFRGTLLVDGCQRAGILGGARAEMVSSAELEFFDSSMLRSFTKATNDNFSFIFQSV